MPPRLAPTKYCPSSSPSSFPPSIVRAQRTPPSSRPFSHTPCQQVTLRRRKFYEWLNGPGRQLKEPLPGSTNYLGAYDKFGNLVRAGPNWRRPDSASTPTQQMRDGDETVKTDTSGEPTPSGQESLDKLEAAIRSGEAEEKETKEKGKQEEDVDDDSKLPPETAEDLRPFPLNQYFRSQPVLSEELREAIYQRVKKDGATVSLASVEFGVSNERVGAVVRLKQMEKEWIAQVCLPFITFNLPPSRDMMRHLKKFD